MTDQQRFDAVGFNGNPHVRTPHLDALATRSVNFTRHTCSTPFCTPARASILTGLYPRTHGAPMVGYSLPTTTPNLAKWLSAAGYQCGLFGKAHLEPELSGFTERLRQDAPYYGFHQTALSEDNLIGPYVNWIRREHPAQEPAMWTQANEPVQIHHGGKTYSPPNATRLDEVYPSPLPVELTQSNWITNQTEQFVRQQQSAGKPFFAVCSYVPPHHPQTPPEPYASLYDPATLPVTPRIPASLAAEYQLDHYSYIPNLPDSELQRYMAAYYGLCTMLDDCIGRLLQTLRDTGADRDTIIVFTSDHGDFNGDFGLVRKGGPWFDSLLHVPLLVHVPGHSANGSRRAAITQHEDLAPTLLELLGLPVPRQVQGVSFAGALNDAAVRPRSHAFYEFACAEEPFIHGVSDGRWKYLNYQGIAEVLVEVTDLQSEIDNHAGQPSTTGIQTRLQQELYEWLLRTQPFRLPRQHTF